MLEAKAYRRRRRRATPRRSTSRRRSPVCSTSTPRGRAAATTRSCGPRSAPLVIARNERRARRGEEPLDVEAETDRQLADLIGLEGR